MKNIIYQKTSAIEENMEVYLIIKKIIDEWDPAYFLSEKAPLDEYDFESEQILNKFLEINTSEELGEYIYNLFQEVFGYPMNIKSKQKSECNKIAEKIFNKTSTI